MSHLSEAILHDTTGITLTLHDASIAAMLRDYADFFVIDAASRPFSAQMIQSIIHAARDVPVLVRTENCLPSTLQGYLNLGVDGLILTDINHAAEAEKAIAACLYPPEGVRHYRVATPADKVSLQALNDQITLIVEITSQQAITQISEICEVTGINGVLVSPSRIAVALERHFDVDDDHVQASLRQVHVAAHGYELPFGLEGDGFDCTAGFTMNLRDVDLLAYGLEYGIKTGSVRVLSPEGTAFGAQNIAEEQEDDSFGMSLVATR